MLKPEDLKTVDLYKKAIHNDAAKLRSGTNTRFWVYKNIDFPAGSGKQTVPVFFVLFDDRDVLPLLRGKSPVCKGKCGMDSGRLVFLPDSGTLPVDLLKASVPALLGHPLHIPPADNDAPPDHSGFDVDKLKKLAIASWSGSHLVKVVSAKRGPLTAVEGYVTLEKFILGQNPAEIGRRLGLPSSSVAEGIYVMRLKSLPAPADFELRGYTNTPGGKPFQAGSDYPPGSAVPQWKLVKPVGAQPTVGPDGKPRLFGAGEPYKP